jgi:hypothetical protein
MSYDKKGLMFFNITDMPKHSLLKNTKQYCGFCATKVCDTDQTVFWKSFKLEQSVNK